MRIWLVPVRGRSCLLANCRLAFVSSKGKEDGGNSHGEEKGRQVRDFPNKEVVIPPKHFSFRGGVFRRVNRVSVENPTRENYRVRQVYKRLLYPQAGSLQSILITRYFPFEYSGCR